MKDCLIVDDSPVVRSILKNIILDLGFECREAENGEIALRECASQFPNAITLDWNMPIMDGLEFLKKLRKMEGGKGPKVIFCTSETDVKKIRKALDAGADEYVMKPFDAEIIANKFRRTGLLEE